jgi:hypothetical protein
VSSVCAPGTTGFKHFNPTQKTIGSDSSDPSLFHIENDANGQIEQVFTFTNIPATAKSIGLKWYISETVPEFYSKGTATAGVLILDGTKLDLSGPVLTADAVNGAVDKSFGQEGSVGGAGFGFWADPEFKKPHDHIISGTDLPAKESLSFKIWIKDLGDVLIRQTGQDGLYLQYDC